MNVPGYFVVIVQSSSFLIFGISKHFVKCSVGKACFVVLVWSRNNHFGCGKLCSLSSESIEMLPDDKLLKENPNFCLLFCNCKSNIY